MYQTNEDLVAKYSTLNMPLEYKILQWRLVINRQLYEEDVIDLKVFSEMEKTLLGRMTKIRNEVNKKISITT